MPDSLKRYLEGLSDTEAQALWNYLDGWPVVAQDMIEVLVDSHPRLPDVVIGRPK